jgi:uncharacterized protein (DUF1697 family)
LTTYVALLRAVNVGGRKPIAMPQLRGLIEDLGFEDPRTLLQSGNLVLRGQARPAAELELLLESELRKRLGLETDVFVRTAKEWSEIVARNPYPAEATRDPAHLLVLCLKTAPGGARVDALRASITGPETIEAAGRQLYAVYPEGIGRSRLTTALIEKHLGTRATGRNWNTVVKLSALAAA